MVRPYEFSMNKKSTTLLNLQSASAGTIMGFVKFTCWNLIR